MERYEKETILGIEIDASAAETLKPHVIQAMNDGLLTENECIALLSRHIVLVINFAPLRKAA